MACYGRGRINRNAQRRGRTGIASRISGRHRHGLHTFSQVAVGRATPTAIARYRGTAELVAVAILHQHRTTRLGCSTEGWW